MKANTLLLGMLVSSALGANELSSPSHPGLLTQDLQHSHEHHAQQLIPKPPRQVSPNEFDKIQAKLYAERHNRRLPVHLIPDADKVMLATSAQSLAENSCTDPASLLPLYGADLVSAVENADLTSCLYGLYNNNFAGTEHFSDAKIFTIVQAINTRLTNFDGSDAGGAVELERLVTYLRAMHSVEETNRAFAQEYRDALVQAFNLYFAGDHFITFIGNASRNFMLRYEMLILVTSSGTDRLPYLKRFSQAIKGYASTVSRTDNWGVTDEENGMTQLLTHYFNAVNAGGNALQQLLINEPQIISNLSDFVRNDALWLIGHTREYQWADAVTELGRMLKFEGDIAQTVRPVLQHILNTYKFNGVGSKGWVNAQSMVKLYDSANCQLYGNACDFDLENEVLSGQHTCGATLKIRYQKPISASNLQQVCVDLSAQEHSFHTLFATNANTPVANDQNTALELVIFQSSTDYQNYAGSFFNINTNNGGMYLEGTPFDPDNQARVIAFQATWLQPDFVVWNLEHEYIHYLDGRFNQWGSFNDQPANLVWWGEGLAEYLSQADSNTDAMAAAANKTYQLSELFQTTYDNGDTPRIYYWGYLATRFMFERHRPLIDNELLPTMRAVKYAISNSPCSFDWDWKLKTEATANNWLWLYDDSEWSTGNWVWTCGQQQDDNTPELPEYTPYDDIIAAWGTTLDTEFHQWLDCLVADNGSCAAEPEPKTADLNNDGTIDNNDLTLFINMLYQTHLLDQQHDFNLDGKVDHLDIRALMQQCSLSRCNTAQ
ncbi:collagenase [Arsukibacterium sp.]|uniref:collagenase n=1 Tax=Arsukibacterium sp. TaxID=1977258 RepID=UPI002FDA2420